MHQTPISELTTQHRAELASYVVAEFDARLRQVLSLQESDVLAAADLQMQHSHEHTAGIVETAKVRGHHSPCLNF